MNFLKFCVYTVLGSLPWCFLLAFAGYKLKAQYENLATYFHGADYVIGAVIVLLVALYVYRHIKHDRAARAAQAARQVQRANGPDEWGSGRPYQTPRQEQMQRPDQAPRRPSGMQRPNQGGPNREDMTRPRR